MGNTYPVQNNFKETPYTTQIWLSVSLLGLNLWAENNIKIYGFTNMTNVQEERDITLR